jgi:hypothetical protein
MKADTNEEANVMDEAADLMPKQKKNPKNNPRKDTYAMQTGKPNNTMLSQVVGIIVGSPEFQRK